VTVRAWDGSEAGSGGDAPVLDIRRRRALRRLLWDPDEMGFARAYVTGDLDVEGDLYDGLARCWRLVRGGDPAGARPGLRDRFGMALAAVRLGAIGPRPAPPAREARLSGTKHSRARDQAAISHHYDLSNAFYACLLGETMAYSCGYWTSDDPTYSAADAQRDKLDLICTKLGLEPGMRLLDVGCGWGSLIVHAAEHYGVLATGVTISSQQREHVQSRIAGAGLAGRVCVRLQDYRELAGDAFDAVASIEMGEHVGRQNYPAYAAALARMVRPGGRVLIQQMSRGPNAPAAPGGGPFIESYIAPDMSIVGIGETLGALEDAGLEIRDVHVLREHYVQTILAWEATLERDWHEFARLVGEDEARVWRLYLTGAALAFAENRMGVNQILAARTPSRGGSGMPLLRPGGEVVPLQPSEPGCGEPA
jgi:cyclopropane-fatty-acyl-phospholipid synthase